MYAVRKSKYNGNVIQNLWEVYFDSEWVGRAFYVNEIFYIYGTDFKYNKEAIDSLIRKQREHDFACG